MSTTRNSPARLNSSRASFRKLRCAEPRRPAAMNGIVGMAEERATRATSPNLRTKGKAVGGVRISASPASLASMKRRQCPVPRSGCSRT